MYFQFGSGDLYLNPNAGNLAANPTPVRPFTIQDVKIESKGKIESLRGSLQYPDDTATGDKDGTFEFSMGRVDYFLMNQIVNADVVAVGGVSVAVDTVTIAATVTPTFPATGTFKEDLGVTWIVPGATQPQQMKLATGTPTTGEYTEALGVYTFAAADVTTGGTVSIACAYAQTTIGATYQVNNQSQGYGPAFEAFIVDKYQGVTSTGAPVYSCVRLYAAKTSDVGKDNKRSGYSMVSLKGAFFASPSGRVIDYFSNNG
jgi:hypothetical protein